MATVLDTVITPALQRIGVLDAVETPTAADSAVGLRVLNGLMDQWAAENLQIYEPNTRTTFTITSGDGTYSVGASQTVNRARPVFVNHVNYIDTSQTPDLEYQLQPLTDDAYASIPQKDLESVFPTTYYYNPTFPYGVITFWPVPTSTTLQGVLYAPTAVTEFAAIGTSLSLPPGYKRMLETNLAMELLQYFPERGMPVGLDRAAADAKAAVKRANIRLMDLSVDAAALIQGRSRTYWYSIFSGP